MQPIVTSHSRLLLSTCGCALALCRAVSFQRCRLASSTGSPSSVAPAPPRPLPRKRRAAGDADVLGFADSRQLHCTAGRGGDGMISFNRYFCNPMAGPGGGDGGNGGHVVLRCNESVRDLSAIPPEVRAEAGRGGGGSNCHGRSGGHRMLDVPLGTQIMDEAGRLLCELQEHGQVYVAARGGAGGKGNAFFLSNSNRAPQLGEYGAAGESRPISLHLRILADAGFVGYPNAGKSSLLRAVSRARPRISPQPFTTLQPHVGVVKFPNLDISVADIPGLIDGAHENRGLGHDFLRHISRCPCLICVIDLGAPDPLGQVETLCSELDHFSPGMSQSVRLVVANKSDLSYSADNLKLLLREADSLPGPVLALSAKTGDNVSQFIDYLHSFFSYKSYD